MLENSGALNRYLMRTSYFLGVALRQTMVLMVFPVRILSGQKRNRPARAGRFLRAGQRRPELSSRLSRIDDRLRTIEQSLLAPDDLAAAGPQVAESSAENLPAELFESLTDPDPGIRQIALGTLGEFGSERAVGLIVEALHDPDSGVRCAAAAAAADALAPRAVFSLILALADPVFEVRMAVGISIERITGSKIRYDPSAEPATRVSQIDELKAWWTQERIQRLAVEVESVLES
jgi:hypothetical protein